MHTLRPRYVLISYILNFRLKCVDFCRLILFKHLIFLKFVESILDFNKSLLICKISQLLLSLELEATRLQDLYLLRNPSLVEFQSLVQFGNL